jgi:hypothetical protein
MISFQKKDKKKEKIIKIAFLNTKFSIIKQITKIRENYNRFLDF